MPTTNRTKALWMAFVSGVTGYIAYFIALPPNLQTGIMGDIITCLPASWQPMAAGVMKTIATVLGFYAAFKMAQHQPEPTYKQVKE